MENNENSGNKKLLTILLVLLLITNAVTLYLYITTNKQKTDVTTEKIALEENVNSLTDTLEAKQDELEEFRGINAELDSMIDAKQAEIEEQKKSISNLIAKGKMTGKELAKAKALVAQYETSIAEMRTQIEKLEAEKAQLTQQNEQLSTDLTAEKATTSKLSDENLGLSKKVELGSLLQVRNMEVAGIRKKSSGKEINVSRVKQVESLRITFETGDNKVLDAGNVSLYVRIINPKGETISVADQGSGSMKMADSDREIQYTKKADFDWNQTNKKLIVYWSQNITAPGTYKVEIYQSGYVVGLGQVELK